MEYLLLVLSVIAMVVSLYIYFTRYMKAIPVYKNFKLFIILFMVVSAIPLFNFKGIQPYYGLRALLVLIISFFMISHVFRTNILTKVFLLLNYFIYIFTGFLFFSTIILTIKGQTISLDSVNQNTLYNLSYLLSYMFAIIMFMLIDKVIVKNKILSFFNQKNVLLNLVILQIVLIFNAIFLVSERSIQEYLGWFNRGVIFNTVAIYFTYVLSFILSLNIGYLSGYKFYSQTLKQQLDTQLSHYKKYEDYMQSLAKFQHDYEKINHALTMLDQNTAKDIFVTSKEELDQITSKYKKYSNHYILDALILDFKTKLEKIGLKFKDVFLPVSFEMSEYDFIKLFYNIFQNIYEALVKVELADRALEIKQYVSNNYQIYDFKNTAHGANYQFKTTKTNKILHGYGLTIIEDIVQKYGGIVTKEIKLENEKYYFEMKLYFSMK
ncbi:GHKL domain-containing protein [Acholeplasma hippikon]|uniref:Sensor histidine kinase NatK-like C-terminal domain-containing protein n=1 Tax=Acholeplasma hippikon TaxID=264636 RepID=A0A449BI08_9MOLU|nr:GHKL domain-containing protein [Acholeplasma hippikon]VEU82089.1 Uncharacterised protein [Acholeplasma hippikon]